MREERRVEIRADTDGRRISGTVVRYGDVADIGGYFREEFRAGSITATDVVLNAYHDSRHPLARTDGGGLEVRDTSEAMRFEAELPDTSAATDVLTLVQRRVLRGASIEMDVVRDEWRDAGRHRIIHEARMSGIAIVSTPAYGNSEIEAFREVRERALERRTRAELETAFHWRAKQGAI